METGLGRVHVVVSVSCGHEDIDGNRPGEGTMLFKLLAPCRSGHVTKLTNQLACSLSLIT